MNIQSSNNADNRYQACREVGIWKQEAASLQLPERIFFHPFRANHLDLQCASCAEEVEGWEKQLRIMENRIHNYPAAG